MPRAPILAALLLFLAACAGDPAVPTAEHAPTPAEIAARDLGFHVRALASGETVAARHADRPAIPASTAKLITAAAARAALAPDARFATRLCAVRPPGPDGRLAGDLILLGGGDPTLDMAGLLTLAERARRAGLTAVAGRLLLDDSRLPPTGPIAPAQPTDAAYNPPLSALMLAEGARRLEWRADGRAWLVPDGTAGAAAVLARPESAPAGRRWLPDPMPSARTGRLMRRLLGDQGIAVGAPTRRAAGCPVEIARVESAPRDAVLRTMLAGSSNPMAELIGLAAARARTGSPVTGIEVAAADTRAWLRAVLPDADLSGLVLPNHSGLSAGARVAPRLMTAILAYAYNGPDESARDDQPFPALLSAGGWDEAVRDRLAPPETALKTWVKTGTMHYGIGLAGYLYAGDGQMYAFAFNASDLARRAAYDPVAADPPDAVETAARAWDAAARAAIDAALIDLAGRLAAD